MDQISKEQRSYNMSRIRSENTKPEETVRKWLFSKGFRYRKNDRRLPGCPDVVLPKYRTVVFVNGCFWHMHENCSKAVMPKSNREFWENKLTHNHQRDQENMKALKILGWNVLIIWECELNKITLEATLNSLEKKIIGQ